MYRQKSIFITAIQWDGSEEQARELNLVRSTPLSTNGNVRYDYVHSTEGSQRILSGDYIVTDTVGRVHVYTQRAFEEHFEKIRV